MLAVDEDAPAMQELRRAQRLMATGAVAAGFQHAVNNPLTALLAEAQLLAMEPLEAEHRAAAERIVEHTRRVIATVAQLKVIASERRTRSGS
jgi:nitrogen-specific signal transduction histidine kinase